MCDAESFLVTAADGDRSAAFKWPRNVEHADDNKFEVPCEICW